MLNTLTVSDHYNPATISIQTINYHFIFYTCFAHNNENHVFLNVTLPVAHFETNFAA